MTRTIAKTAQGDVRGRERGGPLLFAGIPYAAPPVGARRFRPPEPHEGWSGVRDAVRFGPAAPQLPGEGLTGNPSVRWDEDCLTLNVCTPAIDDGRRPVFVWIHGGGYRSGQGAIPWYDGTSFARRGDVVTVTINYRLGALGFAHLAEIGGADYASSGLSGTLDQIAALEWVRDNIAAFGGDPARVTIGGESAGGMSVGTLVGCRAAAGLFRGAIAQSGAADNLLQRADAGEVARRLAALLHADSIADLQESPVERILQAQAQVERQSMNREFRLRSGASLGDMVFMPVVDGVVLPEPPLAAVRAGLSARVALLVGTNRDEMALFGVGRADDERLRRVAARISGDAERALAAYRSEWPTASSSAIVSAIMTDRYFRIPGIRLAEAQIAAGGTAYQYLFTWASRAFEGRLGSTHALEIPFAFDTLSRPGVDVFLGPGPSPQPLADAMHAAWTAFIRSGDPTCDATGTWPAYTTERRAVMELGDSIGVRSDPYGATRALWGDAPAAP
ncbi:MAG TPA: carboxylesterase/lipase family protein [Candidatus Binatia bacterium]|nr:carboxylesterase/lipase family protein [Candidatus Binatia bacterium]